MIACLPQCQVHLHVHTSSCKLAVARKKKQKKNKTTGSDVLARTVRAFSVWSCCLLQMKRGGGKNNNAVVSMKNVPTEQSLRAHGYNFSAFHSTL